MRPEGLSGRGQSETKAGLSDDLALPQTVDTVNWEPGIKNKFLARH